MSTIELKGLKGLRQLESLVTESKSADPTVEHLQHLPLDTLTPGKYQPRKRINDSVLNELADSIKVHGIIQPLIVRKLNENQYEIVAGERRWRAAKLAGLSKVPAVIRDVDDNTTLALALIENLQRENLNPIEEAAAFARLKNEFLMTHSQIAEIVGRSRASITNVLRLITLSDHVKILLQDNVIDMGHARALLTLEKDQQVLVAEKIVRNGLTVRAAEKLVKAIKFPKIKFPKKSLTNEREKQWISILNEKLSSRVSIKLSDDGIGKLIIHVNSVDELDWLVEHIKTD